MKLRRWPYRVIRRYVLIQIPGIVLLILALYLLRRWVQIPVWLAGVILVLWIIKDIVLFPFVWRAYDKYDKGDRHAIIGSQGTAENRLAPTGYVRVGGELWQAEVVTGNPPIEKGESVRVQGSRGMTLLVVPDRDEERG